jgi:hypothetical protein
MNQFSYGGSNASNNQTYYNINLGGIGGAIIVYNSY